MRGLCPWNYVGKSNTQAEVAEEEAHLKLLMESRLHKQGVPEAGLDFPESTWFTIHLPRECPMSTEHHTKEAEQLESPVTFCLFFQRLPPSPVMPAPRQQALYQRAAWDSCLAHSCASLNLPTLASTLRKLL